MPAPFYNRLREYYASVAKVLRGEAAAATIFPNSTDKGITRERVYADFLELHCPSKCNVSFGGFIFDEEGAESGQMDIIVTADNCPQFNFHNSDGSGKTFSGVEGTLGCVCVKSTLDGAELVDSLEKLASIPPTRSLEGKVPFSVKIHNYEDWPFKIIYASNGIAPTAVMEHLLKFYSDNPDIPENRKPNIIHVAGNYFIYRADGFLTNEGKPIPKGNFVTGTDTSGRDADIYAIALTIQGIHSRSLASGHILFSYDFLLQKLSEQ